MELVMRGLWRGSPILEKEPLRLCGLGFTILWCPRVNPIAGNFPFIGLALWTEFSPPGIPLLS